MSYLLAVVALVSGKTILAVGIAALAIVSLASIAILQQNQLQRESPTTQRLSTGQTVFRTVTAFAGFGPITVTVPTGQYVYIEYWAYADGSFGSKKPKDGYVWLEVGIHVENHGYNRISMDWRNFVVAMPRDNQQYQYNVNAISNLDSSPLPTDDLVNGLTQFGYLVFEVPGCCGFDLTQYSLLYQPASGIYNVQYVNLGVQIRT